jgi:hypothetical protein
VPRAVPPGRSPGPEVTRRVLLAAATLAGGAAALTSCSEKAQPEVKPQPDVAILLSAIATEEQLIAMYESTKRDHPELRKRIDPLLAHHRNHLTVLRRHYRPGTETESSDRPRSSAPPGGRGVPVGWGDTAAAAIGEVGVKAAGAPRSRRQALSALRTAERKAAAARTADVIRVSPGLAQLFASIGACEAGNAAWLARIG